MHHAAAADFQPAAAANRAALAAAQKAFHVELRRGLGEGEEGGSEARAHLLTEQASCQVGKRGFEVAEGDAGSHRQSFDLVELRLVARVGLLVAVAHAGQDQPHRRGILGVGGAESRAWRGSAPGRCACASRSGWSRARRLPRNRYPACRAPGDRWGS